MNDNRNCGTCEWYAKFEGVCYNGESEHRIDFVNEEDFCEKWSGEMGNWKRELSPRDLSYGTGWCADMDRCFKQGGKYVVLSRVIMTKIGEVEHLAIRNKDNSDIPWAEKYRIKNELIGRNRTAIEVFPDTDRLVDAAGMYHLWILPDNFNLPFGIHSKDEHGDPVHRPLMMVKKN